MARHVVRNTFLVIGKRCILSSFSNFGGSCTEFGYFCFEGQEAGDNKQHSHGTDHPLIGLLGC